MALEYRRLTENELEVFIDMRINQLREDAACFQVCLLIRNTADRASQKSCYQGL